MLALHEIWFTELLFGLLIISGAMPQLTVIAAGIPFNATEVPRLAIGPLRELLAGRAQEGWAS